MRVHVVGRRGSDRRLGGDALQMQETAAVLRDAGIAAEVTDPAVAPRRGDVVHLHNIQRVHDWGDLPERARAAGASVVVTPLYHPTGEYHRRGRRGLDAHLARLVPDPDRFAGLRWGRGAGLAERAGEVLTLADRVLIVDEGERQLLEADLGAIRSPCAVVPVAIPEAPQEAAEAPFDEPFLACVGRIEPLKDPASVLEAALSAGIPVAFAGPGAGARHAGYVARFQAAVRRAGRARVRHLGELPRDDVLSMLRAAHAHVLASWTEVVGRATLEAAQAGAAVVATDVGFAPSYFEGTPIRLVPPGEPQALADALRAAMAAPRPGRDGPLAERVRARFTWTVVARRLVAAVTGAAS